MKKEEINFLLLSWPGHCAGVDTESLQLITAPRREQETLDTGSY